MSTTPTAEQVGAALEPLGFRKLQYTLPHHWTWRGGAEFCDVVLAEDAARAAPPRLVYYGTDAGIERARVALRKAGLLPAPAQPGMTFEQYREAAWHRYLAEGHPDPTEAAHLEAVAQFYPHGLDAPGAPAAAHPLHLAAELETWLDEPDDATEEQAPAAAQPATTPAAAEVAAQQSPPAQLTEPSDELVAHYQQVAEEEAPRGVFLTAEEAKRIGDAIGCDGPQILREAADLIARRDRAGAKALRQMADEFSGILDMLLRRYPDDEAQQSTPPAQPQTALALRRRLMDAGLLVADVSWGDGGKRELHVEAYGTPEQWAALLQGAQPARDDYDASNPDDCRRVAARWMKQAAALLSSAHGALLDADEDWRLRDRILTWSAHINGTAITITPQPPPAQPGPTGQQ